MNDISNLKTFTKNHSLSEAVFTIFLAQEILKPERFEVLLQSELNEFHEFGHNIAQNINIRIDQLELEEREIDGFVFRKYEAGKVAWAIVSKNKPVPYIAIHCLNYDRWIPFTTKVESYLKALANFQKDLFIKAFGLNNIDQFYWISKSYPDLEIIFRTDSELLPKKFFESKEEFTYTIKQTFHKSDDVDGKYVDRVDVFAKNLATNNINIGVIHNVIKQLDASIEIKKLIDEFSKTPNPLDWAHQLNKTTLKKLLTQSVVDLIKLK